MLVAEAILALVLASLAEAEAKPPLLRAGSIGEADYPAAALAARAEGTTRVRFLVAATGRVTDCAVIGSSGHAALDAASCAILVRRFQYRPLADASGAPRPSWHSRTISWTLPGANPLAPGKKPASG
jgi:TonB family protein